MAERELNQLQETSETTATDASQINPNALFNEYKYQADQAHDQQTLMRLREELILKANTTDDHSLLAAIEASNHYIEIKCKDVPEVNHRYCNELFAHGIFCIFGTVIIVLTLLSVLNPSILVLAPAFLVMSLSIGFTFKNAVQYLGTPGVFKQTTEFTKLILSLAVTAEIFFYNLTDVADVTFQSSGVLATVVLSLGLITLMLSGYIFALAIKARQEIGSYLKYKAYFNNVVELENDFIILNELKSGNFTNFLRIGKANNLFGKLQDKDLESFKKAVQSLINENHEEDPHPSSILVKLIGANDTYKVEKAIAKAKKFEAFKAENEQSSKLLKTSFSQSMPLVAALDQKTYDREKITLYLRGIIGAMGDNADQKPSRELSDHCLAKIKTLLQNDNGKFKDDEAQKCFTILELEARLVQMDQPYIKNIPYRLTADALLILSSMALHIMIGFGIGATIYITAPIFALGVLSLMLFTFNEYRDFKRKHFILGISTTYISFIMMMVIFVAIVGGIGFNPLFLGFGIPLVIVMAYAAKRFWLEPKQNLIVSDIEKSIQKSMTDQSPSLQNDQKKAPKPPSTQTPHPDLEEKFVKYAEELKPLLTEESINENEDGSEQISNTHELKTNNTNAFKQKNEITKQNRQDSKELNEGSTDQESETSDDGDSDSEGEGKGKGHQP